MVRVKILTEENAVLIKGNKTLVLNNKTLRAENGFLRKKLDLMRKENRIINSRLLANENAIIEAKRNGFDFFKWFKKGNETK